MPTQTTNYDLNLCLVNDPTDMDLWGTYLNDNFTAIDTTMKANADAIAAITFDLSLVYPVGSVYINASVATNPATLLGFTSTWASLGAGRLLMGVGTGTDINGDTLTVAAGATGGEYNHVLTSGENAAHKHFIAAAEVATQPRTSEVNLTATGQAAASGVASSDTRNYVLTNTATAATVGLTSSSGSGTKHNNTPPYISVYIWQRTA